MANTIEFPRGDGIHHKFYIPVDSWTAGGELFFAAKAVIDDDNTDAAAVINRSWTDSDLLDNETVRDIEYKVYDCYFPPSATSSINSDGADSLEYLGEFQFVPLDGDPITFPPRDPKLKCVVYFDVKRSTTTP